MEYAVLFGGQGYHCPEMLDIIKGSSGAYKYLEYTCDKLDLSLKQLDSLLNEEVLENKYSQPLLSTYSYAIWKEIENDIPKPLVFAGFSLGELAAYGCADSFSFEVLIDAAITRARLMEEETPADIQVVAIMGIREESLRSLCKETDCVIMIVSETDHFTIAGSSDNIKCLCSGVNMKYPYAEIREVAIKVPSHTKYLTDASDKFMESIKIFDIKNPTVPVIAGIDGRLVKNKNVMARTLALQIKQTLMWNSCCENVIERGPKVFLEISPGNILSKMMKRRNSDFKTNSTSAFTTIKGISDWVNKYCR